MRTRPTNRIVYTIDVKQWQPAAMGVCKCCDPCWRPVCPGLNMGTSIFMNAVVVACAIAMSDWAHREFDPDNRGNGVLIHTISAFVIMWTLETGLYITLWYGRGSLANRDAVGPVGVRDYFGCPDTDNCYTDWLDTLRSDTYTTHRHHPKSTPAASNLLLP
jgi:hypothetical protein